LMMLLLLPHFTSQVDALSSTPILGGRMLLTSGAVCIMRIPACRLAVPGCPRRQMLRLAMSDDMEPSDDVFAGLDEVQKKFKAAAMRKEAMDLDEAATSLRKSAVGKEQEAAKLRIQAWKLEGGVSAVTRQITVKDKYQKQLAELDLMAEDWVDTDEEKWEWYQQQRKMIIDMIGAQKDYDAKADESLQDLKEVLLELQQTLDIQTVLPNGDITSAGWGFIILSVSP
jgi:hypothetical protein